MPAELPVDITRRLAFSKYLYTLGKVQAKQRWPLNSAGLLMFHDAVEFFLQIASEHLDVGKAQPTFLDYWDLLSARTPEPLSQKEAMRRLNKARVALKHHGTTPSSEDIAAFGETTSRFFDENTQKIFGVSFKGLSLVEFVEPTSARDRLRKAEAALAAETVSDETLVDLALAFEEIIGRREREISPGPFAIFPFGRQFELDRFMFRFNREVDQTVAQTLTSLGQAVGLLQRVCKLLVLGVDFTGVLRFQAVVPEIIRFEAGNIEPRFRQGYRVSSDDIDFCIQFAVETALQLQQGIKPWPVGA